MDKRLNHLQRMLKLFLAVMMGKTYFLAESTHHHYGMKPYLQDSLSENWENQLVFWSGLFSLFFVNTARCLWRAALITRLPQ